MTNPATRTNPISPPNTPPAIAPACEDCEGPSVLIVDVEELVDEEPVDVIELVAMLFLNDCDESDIKPRLL